MKNAITWFEIPSTDLERATKFYETIFSVSLFAMDMPNIKMRIFPVEDKKAISGAIVNHSQYHNPSSTEGVIIYLNADPDIQIVLDKVEEAGGTILIPKTEISPDFGFYAVIIDTEGNRIGLRSGAI